MATVMTNLSGYVTSASPRGGCGQIQQYGNFPRVGQNADEPGNNFEDSVHQGFTYDGQFEFRSAQVSEGQSVLFDLVEDALSGGVLADNVRVP
jgi:hypothetical protein